jgi:hypothetical protein
MKEKKLKRQAEALSRTMGISIEAAREFVLSIRNPTPDGFVEWSLPLTREIIAALDRSKNPDEPISSARSTAPRRG